MKLILSILILSFSLPLLASGTSNYKGIQTIHQRQCTADMGFEITLKEAHANPDSCANNLVVDLACDHPAFNSISSIALTAFVTGKNVRFWLNGCDSHNQAKIVTIEINN